MKCRLHVAASPALVPLTRYYYIKPPAIIPLRRLAIRLAQIMSNPALLRFKYLRNVYMT